VSGVTNEVLLSVLRGVSALVLGAWLSGCKAQASTRQWFRCACSYISDFDDPGAAPIDVCAEKRDAEEIASICTRNAGVGVPTSCRCEAETRGPCERSDRCRTVDSPQR
jgi:hypothetical protein